VHPSRHRLRQQPFTRDEPGPYRGQTMPRIELRQRAPEQLVTTRHA
jgi:hypothetical protein